MRTLAILAAVAIGGCVPVSRTAVQVSRRTVSAPVPTETRPVVVSIDRHDGVFVLSAVWPRRCRRAVIDEVATTRTREPRIAGTSNGDVWGWFVALPAAVIAWPIGLGTAAVAIASSRGTSTTHATEAVAALTVDCTIPARDIAVHLTLPSGTMIDGRTDDRGQFALVVPAHEPEGEIRITTDAPRRPTTAAPPTTTVEAPPEPARTAGPTLGGAVLACGTRLGLDGIAKLALVVGGDGAIVSVTTDRDDALASCLRDTLSDVRVPGMAGRSVEVPFLLRRP